MAIKETLLKEYTDEQIMNEVAEGNLEKLGFLFERHHTYLYNFLFKMCGNQDLSKDIVQETFFNILKYRKTYNGGKFISWMFTISRNILSEHLKGDEKNLSNLDWAIHKIDMNVTADFSLLYIALSKLKPEDKELLILNRLKEIKYYELAQIFDSTPNTVKTKVNRALKKLRIIYFKSIG